MALKNSDMNWGGIARFFHWTVALLVLAMLPVGFYMAGLEPGPFQLDIYWWHKSTGLLILFLMGGRFLWRACNRRPKEIDGWHWWEKLLSRVVHALLYALLFIMPFSGWIMASAGNFPLGFFGLFDMPPIVGPNEDLLEAAEEIHEFAAFGIIALLLLHVAGAYKHAVMNKDGTLRRMMPAGYMGIVGSTIPGVLLVLSFSLVLYFEFFGEHEHEGGGHAIVLREQAQPGGHVPAEVPRDVPAWEIKESESRLIFKATQQGREFQGTFEKFGGDIFFDPANLADSHVDVWVDVSSVRTGASDRDDFIGAPDWLAAVQYPRARFTAEEFWHEAPNQFVAVGELTLRGVTLPMRIPFTALFSDDPQGERTATVTGGFSIDRLAYDIGGGQWADAGTVGREVSVFLALTAKERD